MARTNRPAQQPENATSAPAAALAPWYIRLTSNFYFITGLIFGVWVLFFDSSSLLNVYYWAQKESSLKVQQVHYQQQIEQLRQQMEAQRTQQEELERFARERYLFRKSGEDVYLVKEKESTD